mgnify:CR=1 FL=1
MLLRSREVVSKSSRISGSGGADSHSSWLLIAATEPAENTFRKVLNRFFVEIPVVERRSQAAVFHPNSFSGIAEDLS